MPLGNDSVIEPSCVHFCSPLGFAFAAANTTSSLGDATVVRFNGLVLVKKSVTVAGVLGDDKIVGFEGEAAERIWRRGVVVEVIVFVWWKGGFWER
ncbi:conserved hypothetical protein [Ricinus communis]|uniref:Uncharacterized protein n=1 Tax=Ricinus communis TaxID=3988 RepID=B9SKC2_RICCO|nr:conserved hypothetical protein [Ricinus communis]